MSKQDKKRGGDKPGRKVEDNDQNKDKQGADTTSKELEDAPGEDGDEITEAEVTAEDVVVGGTARARELER